MMLLICRSKSAALINNEDAGADQARDEDVHRSFLSENFVGQLDAVTPADARPEDYDLIGLAMQEPPYSNHRFVT